MSMLGEAGPRRRTSLPPQVDSGKRTELKSDMVCEDRKATVSSPQQHRASRSKSVALAILIFVFASLILYETVSQGGQNLRLFEGVEKAPPIEGQKSLEITLHPEKHAYRKHQVITLDWTVSAETRAPDGVTKRVYLVNDLFPGPTIEARSGDELVINVHNGLENEGVAIHWHGLHVPNAMDGAVGFTQCPTAPGGNFTYRFNVRDHQHGTYWWHAHFQSQRGNGLFGGLVIHEPRTENADAEEPRPSLSYQKDVLLMVGDWFYRSADDVLQWYTSVGAFGNEPVPDSLLINGKGRFNCSMALPARPIECRQIAYDMLKLDLSESVPTRLRLINVGTIAGFSLSLDGASLQPVSVDGGSKIVAEPAALVGVIYPGERVDVIMRWAEPDTAHSRLRIQLDPENFKYPNPALDPKQSFRVMKSTSGMKTTAQTFQSTPIDDLDLSAAHAPIDSSHDLPAAVSQRIVVYVKTQKLARFSNHPMGFINHTSWTPQTPPLMNLPRSAWDKNQLVPYVNLTQESSESAWVDLVINNLDDGSHPFHLHGHAFYVISAYRAQNAGWGSWNPYSGKTAPGGLNLATPLLKDTVQVPRRGHVVLRFKAQNPGLWMLHCHMLVHLGSGMAMGIHVGSEEDEAHILELDEEASSLCNIA